jgi:hypothetical protein
MRWRALPLAEIEPFHSTQICRVKIPRGSLDVDSRLFSEVQINSKSRVPRIGLTRGKMRPVTTSHQNPQFYVQPSSVFCWTPPCSAASFELNSEPHTGARPSVRLCGANNWPNYRWIGIWRCTCRDWPFSSGSKPIDLGLEIQVHWVHI